MTRAQRPVLTVRSGPSQRSFAAGPDVIVGSDLHADLRVAHPLIDRAHLLLRFEQGSWVPIDNNSQSGIYVDGRRVPLIDIRDGLAMNLGRADGPRITFEVGHHQGVIGLLPPPETMPGVAPADRPPSGGPSPSGPGYRPGPPSYPSRPSWPSPPPDRPPDPVASAQLTSAIPLLPPPARPGAHTTASHYPDRTVDVLGADSGLAPALADTISIGRAASNDIVVSDVLASRHHAFLTPTRIGTEIRDAHSINGTFVNGIRVGSAILSDGDIVTIGNVDLAFTGGTLARHTQVATRAGGLEVNAVNFSINGNGLLENISLTARPGTLTAVIGGSGAGKTTLSRLIAGYTSPSSGTVTFEGHNIHADYASLRSRIGMVPQDDVVHRKLTVNQALGYAAELRLPPDTSKEDRAQVVAGVLDELGLTQHADTRVDKLSGGQRKRASVALELLTGPSLLILDEPTSGLDPALDLQVMMMLRQLADAGRVALVVTHSLTYLDICDQVLLMAPGGQDGVSRSARSDRPSHGHHQLGPHLRQGGRRSGRGQSPLPGPAPRRSTRAAADAHRPRCARPHQRAAPVLHHHPPTGSAGDRRPRLLRLPRYPAVHSGCAVADGSG